MPASTMMFSWPCSALKIFQYSIILNQLLAFVWSSCISYYDVQFYITLYIGCQMYNCHLTRMALSLYFASLSCWCNSHFNLAVDWSSCGILLIMNQVIVLNTICIPWMALGGMPLFRFYGILMVWLLQPNGDVYCQYSFPLHYRLLRSPLPRQGSTDTQNATLWPLTFSMERSLRILCPPPITVT
jgi:hypothetical protein